MRDSYSRAPLLSRRWLWFVLFAVFAMGLASGVVYAFLNAGMWLIREDPLERTQAVVVLSGGLPPRALAAAEIFRAGNAREVWLTRPRQPAAAMRALDLPYSGEEEYSRMVLIAKGVPPSHIRILDQQIDNTADELAAVLHELELQQNSTAIVVTAKSHTRRVRSLWSHIVGSSSRARILIRSAPQDSFDAGHWWRTTSDALSVVREYLGLLNAWTGLPLRPSNP